MQIYDWDDIIIKIKSIFSKKIREKLQKAKESKLFYDKLYDLRITCNYCMGYPESEHIAMVEAEPRLILALELPTEKKVELLREGYRLYHGCDRLKSAAIFKKAFQGYLLTAFK